MSDDTSAQPAPAQSAETASGGSAAAAAAADSSAPASVAPVVDAKVSKSDELSAGAADGAATDTVKAEDQGTVAPFNPLGSASTSPIALLRDSIGRFV